MKTSLRLVASVLTSALLFSVFSTGCSSVKIVSKKPVYVEEDTNWYTVQRNDVGTEYNLDDYIFFGQTILGNYKDMYVFETEGKVQDYATADFEGRVMNLDFYSENGKLVKSVDIEKLLYEKPEIQEAQFFLLNTFYLEGDEIKLSVDACYFDDTNSYTEENITYVFDFESEKISDASGKDSDSYATMNDGTVVLGNDYTITKYWDYEGSNGYRNILHLKGPEGTDESINLANIYPDSKICGVDCIIGMDDTTAIVGVTDSGTFQHMWFTIDLPTAKYEKYQGDMGWLSSINPENITYVTGMGCYALDTEGIKRLDFEAREVELVIDFNECNINRFDIPYLRLYSFSDDEAILAGAIYTKATGVNEETHSCVYKISKCDTNPNVGKEIITLASTTDMNDALAQAIFDFNQSSSECFIVFDASYSLTDYLYEHSSESTGDILLDTYEAQSKLNAKLTQDILAGSGPDIILDAFDCNLLNKSECLMDLSKFVNSESGLLTNVIKSAKLDGKLYQMPLAFGIKGIVTDSANVSKKGFTFEEYSKFVDEVCNGVDPLKMDRIDFFDEVLASMNNLIIEHGGDNTIKTKALMVAAEYAKNNVPEFYYDNHENVSGATYADIDGFSEFILGEYTNGGFDLESLTVVGLPSVDRRGPTIVVKNSVAIAADVANPDACWSFCQSLMSEEIQSRYFADGTPVNEKVLSEMCDKSIDAYNKLRESYILDDVDELMLYEFGMALPVDNSYTSKYVDIVKSCSVISNNYDATVKMLIRQEIQAYFSGDKTLDEVCKIAQSEIKIYMDEIE